MCLLFTNHKLPSLHSELVPISRSKASTYTPKKKMLYRLCFRGVTFYKMTKSGPIENESTSRHNINSVQNEENRRQKGSKQCEGSACPLIHSK